jgi:hypothetical protein
MELGKPLRTLVVEPLKDPIRDEPKQRPVTREAEEPAVEEECAPPITPAR